MVPASRQVGRFTGLLVLLLPLLASCIVGRHPAGIATASAPVSANYTVIGPAEASSCLYRVLFIPLGGKDPTHEIIAGLVKEKGGDALIGVVVEHRSMVFPLPLFGSDCTIVNGLVVKNPR